jgi:hypothetical protein
VIAGSQLGLALVRSPSPPAGERHSGLLALLLALVALSATQDIAVDATIEIMQRSGWAPPTARG